MKQITIKYAVTGQFGRDAMMGVKWLKEHCASLFERWGYIKTDVISSNWKTVAVRTVHDQSDYEIMNALWEEFNHISTEQLKHLNGYDAEFSQDQDDGDVDRMIKSNKWFDEKNPDYAKLCASDRRYYWAGVMGWIAHTSMSVGDMIIIENEQDIKYYIVDNQGFTQVKVVYKEESQIELSRAEAVKLVDLITKHHETSGISMTICDLLKRIKTKTDYDPKVHQEYLFSGDEDHQKSEQFTKEMIVQYFEIDTDNCLTKREDFCETIAQILNNPVKSREYWSKEITEYYNEREIDIWDE